MGRVEAVGPIEMEEGAGRLAGRLTGRARADFELEDLAARARVGSQECFEELVRRLTPRILGFATGILRDRGLAEEASQETFVRLYRFLPGYRAENFPAWCFAIAHNACLDLVRREQRAARARTIEPDRRPDPLEAAEIRRAVGEAVGDLPRGVRTTFVLHQQGLSYRDIAAVLACPVGTVRSRLHDARRRLRESLRDVLGTEGE